MHAQFWDSFRRLPMPAGYGRPDERVYAASFWAWGLHSDVHLVITCNLKICQNACNVSCIGASGGGLIGTGYEGAGRPPAAIPTSASDTSSAGAYSGQGVNLRAVDSLQQSPKLKTLSRRLHDDVRGEFTAKSELSLQSSAVYEVDDNALDTTNATASTPQLAHSNGNCVSSTALLVMAFAWMCTLIAALALAGWFYVQLRKVTVNVKV
ncbi:unnamed protein product [Sphagnum balticum]